MHALALEIENFDAGGGGRAEPIAVGREDEGVDDVTSLEGVEVLALIEVPEHGDTVFAAGRRKRAIGRDGDGVDVASVAIVVSLELELLKLPDLSMKLALEQTPERYTRVRDLGDLGSLIGRTL